MLAHVRAACTTDTRRLIHLVQPEYALFLRSPTILPLYMAFSTDY